jgi:IS1 family transposase/transposase-like protein
MQTLFDIITIASDPRTAISFFRSKGILKEQLICDGCRNLMREIMDKSRSDGSIFRCSFCKKMRSIRSGSFLMRSKLSLGQSLLLFYLWTLKTSIAQTAIMVGISEQSAVDWNNLVREICSARFSNENGPTLGGEGCIVQADESIIYKPKHHRGHATTEPQKWVFGLYDVNKKIGVIEFVKDRSADTLLPLIQKHVKPGTEIHTDQWKAYSNIVAINVDSPFIHRTVNHSKWFKDPESGVHTNNVEAYWSSIKKRFKMLNGTSRTLTPSYLDEHMYRERYGKTFQQMFESIIRDIGIYGF